MANAQIATGAEQPINRHGAVAGDEMQEGDLVGLNSDGYMVQAQADESDPQAALGVALTPATDPENYDETATRLTVEANRALIGQDRVTAISNGIEVENGDRDWEFTPGEPVYLDYDGGYTQDAPATVGAIVQVVGTALTEERIRLDVSAGYDVAE